ncbi:MAG: ABC transporter ATP-binding protein, partial [Spirochaetota bacterium]
HIVAELLFTLCRSLGTAMVLVTHDSRLSALADIQYSLENMSLRRILSPQPPKSSTGGSLWA